MSTTPSNSHSTLARTILRRIRWARLPSDPDQAFAAAEQALRSVGVTFTIVETPSSITPVSPALASAA